jgi:hypothetical protein
MYLYIVVGLIATFAVAYLVSLQQVSVVAANAASATVYLGSYLIIAVGSGALLVNRIESLGSLAPLSNAALVTLYTLTWITVLCAARPLAREGLLHLSVTANQVCRLMLLYCGFDPAKPYVLVYRLWDKRRGKPTVLYIRR